MTNKLFVYGTLTFSEVLNKLTDKKFETQKATLNGYKKSKVCDKHNHYPYPAIIKSKNSKVEGKLLFNVDKETLKVIDFFEDEDYERKKLNIKSGNTSHKAFAYVWNNKSDYQLEGRWSRETFKQEYLNDYVKTRIPKILSNYQK